MPKRALYEKRPLLLASILAAAAFFYLAAADIPQIVTVAVKGFAVGLLAVYAYLRHSGPDARILVWVMGLCALGDMVMEFYLILGGLVFFLAHVFSLSLFLRNRCEVITRSQKIAAVVLLVAPMLMGFILPADRESALQVALYGLSVGAMAASAWVSNFPRYRVGVGAAIFVLSIILLFAELGPLANSAIPDALIWPSYYLAQFLICTGVIQTLCKRNPQLRIAASN